MSTWTFKDLGENLNIPRASDKGRKRNHLKHFSSVSLNGAASCGLPLCFFLNFSGDRINFRSWAWAAKKNQLTDQRVLIRTTSVRKGCRNYLRSLTSRFLLRKETLLLAFSKAWNSCLHHKEPTPERCQNFSLLCTGQVVFPDDQLVFDLRPTSDCSCCHWPYLCFPRAVAAPVPVSPGGSPCLENFVPQGKGCGTQLCLVHHGIRVMLWFNPSQQLNPTEPLSLLSRRDEERTVRVKVRKLFELSHCLR